MPMPRPNPRTTDTTLYCTFPSLCIGEHQPPNEVPKTRTFSLLSVPQDSSTCLLAVSVIYMMLLSFHVQDSQDGSSWFGLKVVKVPKARTRQRMTRSASSVSRQVVHHPRQASRQSQIQRDKQSLRIYLPVLHRKDVALLRQSTSLVQER